MLTTNGLQLAIFFLAHVVDYNICSHIAPLLPNFLLCTCTNEIRKSHFSFLANEKGESKRDGRRKGEKQRGSIEKMRRGESWSYRVSYLLYFPVFVGLVAGIADGVLVLVVPADVALVRHGGDGGHPRVSSEA